MGVQRPPATVDPDDERRGKEAAAAAGTGAPAPAVIEPVDEPSEAVVPPFDPAVLPVPVRERLRDVPLPVLLPSADAIGGPDPYGEAVATRGPHWYSIAVPGASFRLSIFGTREAVVRPELTEPGRRGADPPAADGVPRVSRTHGIVQATFRRFGVSYAVEVECNDPEGDPRCTDDGFVNQLVGAMRRLGGGR